MTRERVVTLVLAVVAGLSFSACRADPHDLQAYVIEVRNLGMTESAESDLSMVAAIRTGGTLLTFSKDDVSGLYLSSYMSTACPAPGADPERIKEWQAELQGRVERDVVTLRHLADRDASGFVSTPEAREFRELVEFGYLAAHIVKSEAAAISILARAAHMAENKVAGRVAEYNTLAERLNESSDVKVPMVDLTGHEVRALESGQESW